LNEQSVKGRREPLPVGEAKLVWSTKDKPSRTKFHHQVTQGESLANIIFSVNLSPGVKCNPTIGDNSGRKRDVSGYHQITHGAMLDDIVVCHIKTVLNNDGGHQQGVVFRKLFVGNQQNGQIESLRGTKNYFLDHPRTRIGVDPYLHETNSCLFL
jgi:hypothetical protein